MAHPRAGRPIEAAPVKFVAAVLASEETPLPFPALERLLGRIDYRSEPHPFTSTDYYDDELGRNLVRTIISFEPLRPATDLVRIKLAAAEIERTFEREGRRTVNIDPGYVDFFKIVLASFKEAPQKIYLGEGVWADPVMIFQDGAFRALPWTFPDFKRGVYTGDLEAIRGLYKNARRDRGREK